MKTFAVSLVLLALVVGCVVANHIYINKVANELVARLDAVPSPDDDACVEQAQRLMEYWDRHKTLVGLSVAVPITDRLTEQATLLLSCAQAGDLYGFYSALTLLRDAIEDVARLEKLSIEMF